MNSLQMKRTKKFEPQILVLLFTIATNDKLDQVFKKMTNDFGKKIMITVLEKEVITCALLKMKNENIMCCRVLRINNKKYVYYTLKDANTFNHQNDDTNPN